jgi:4-amino-4-deoxy-L-arabinose transferase-like glycosyltransferase
MNSKLPSDTVAGRLLMVFVLLALCYWGVFSVVCPVTTYDAHVYNLARLAIAEKAGFWQGSAWNSNRQILFPWVFDAVHYPFLKLGRGAALPSFLCLVGALYMIYRLVAISWNRDAARWCVAALLAMPTVMLQASTVKNDLVILFTLTCWFYALYRYRSESRKWLLAVAALSLALMAGSKTSGIPLCGLLFLATLWHLRNRWRAGLQFLLFFSLFLPLFGSVETYILSWQIYHNPLGSKSFIRDSSNRDGIGGALANFVRYYIGNLSLGVDGAGHQSGLTGVLEGACRSFLDFVGLKNVGYRPDFNDANMVFGKSGGDAGSDFGLVGALGMTASTIFLLTRCTTDYIWKLSGAGFLTLFLTSYTIAWMPWNARFLLVPFVAFTIALTVKVFSEPGRFRAVQRLYGSVIIVSALALPFGSLNRRPKDLKTAIKHKEHLMFSEQPQLEKIWSDVRKIRSHNKNQHWYLVAGDDSWTLPFLLIDNIEWTPAPKWETILTKERETGRIGQNAFVLVLGREVPGEIPSFTVMKYSGTTLILQIETDLLRSAGQKLYLAPPLVRSF